MNMQELIKSVCEEGRALYHNASLLHVTWVDNDYVADNMDMWLGWYTKDFCSDLEQEIKERWGLDLDICQFGRGGATIAPDQWYVDYMMGNHFDYDIAYDADGLEGYNQLRQVLAVLEYVNRRVGEGVKALPYAWADYQTQARATVA